MNTTQEELTGGVNCSPAAPPGRSAPGGEADGFRQKADSAARRSALGGRADVHGCVICGGAIYQYDHFEPEFNDATEHNSKGIALLCPNHHEAKKARLLSHEKYMKAVANPKAIKSGAAQTDLEEGYFAPDIIVGDKYFSGGTSILKIGEELLIGFKAPEKPGAPPRLNACFFDRDEKQLLSLVENQACFHVVGFQRIWRLSGECRLKEFM